MMNSKKTGGKTKTHPGQKQPGMRQPNQYGQKIISMPGINVDGHIKYKVSPACPDWIVGNSREFWKRFAKKWSENGRLNKETWNLFCQLATAWGRWRDWLQILNDLAEKQAEMSVKKSKAMGGKPKKNPGMRGLMIAETTSITTNPNGQRVEKIGKMRVSDPAREVVAAEEHFYKMFQKFEAISAKFERLAAPATADYSGEYD